MLILFASPFLIMYDFLWTQQLDDKSDDESKFDAVSYIHVFPNIDPCHSGHVKTPAYFLFIVFLSENSSE